MDLRWPRGCQLPRRGRVVKSRSRVEANFKFCVRVSIWFGFAIFCVLPVSRLIVHFLKRSPFLVDLGISSINIY